MIEIEILLTFADFLECTVVQCKDALSIYWNRHGHECSWIWKLSANFTLIQCIKIVSRFFGSEIYRGRHFFSAEIYRGRLLTLITESSSRLLRIQFSADLTMYWFPVCHFRCMKFKPLVIWIWNQNIAISTIVGTSSHIKYRWNIVGILFMCVCQWAINPTVLSVLKKNILKLIRLTNLVEIRIPKKFSV
jgi:hypothetical protein